MTLQISKQQSLIIKAIAIIFVIMSHTGVFPCGGAIGVHLFLIVSGYGIYCSLEKGAENYWKKRINSVYLPYLFCVSIFLIFRFFMYGKITLLTVIVSLLGQDFNLNVDPTMWYISYIFACYLIAWTIFKLKNRPSVAFLFGVLAFGTITLCGYKYIIWHHGTIAWNYGLSFPLGALLARYRNIDENKAKYVKIGIFFLSFAATALLLPIPHEKFIKFFFTLSCAVFVYSLLTVFEINGKNIMTKIFEAIGKQSYFMYLNEAFLIGAFKLRGGVPINTLIIIVCSFICAYVMHHVFEMFVNVVSGNFCRG